MKEIEQSHETPIGGVPSDKIMMVWDKVEPILRRVVKEDTGYSLQHVLTELQMAKMQLWVIGDFEAAAVTTVEDRPTQRVLFMLFIAGKNVEKWLSDWISVIEDYAQYHGCAAVEFSGRKGWNKIAELKRYDGYKPIRTIVRREF